MFDIKKLNMTEHDSPKIGASNLAQLEAGLERILGHCSKILQGRTFNRNPPPLDRDAALDIQGIFYKAWFQLLGDGENIKAEMFLAAYSAVRSKLCIESALLCALATGLSMTGVTENQLILEATKTDEYTEFWLLRIVECKRAGLWPWPEEKQKES